MAVAHHGTSGARRPKCLAACPPQLLRRALVHRARGHGSRVRLHRVDAEPSWAPPGPFDPAVGLLAQVRPVGRRKRVVHFERLAIEASDTTFTLDFHERLTVIAGVGQLERDGLITELVGALSSGRSGVHLELASDAGTRYALFRPVGAPHRVVDIDRTEDVTGAFTDARRTGEPAAAGRARRSGRQAGHAGRGQPTWPPGPSVSTTSPPSPTSSRAGCGTWPRRSTTARSASTAPPNWSARRPRTPRPTSSSRPATPSSRPPRPNPSGSGGSPSSWPPAPPCSPFPGSIFLGPFITVPLLIAAVMTGLYSAFYWGRLAEARRARGRRPWPRWAPTRT